MKIIEIHRRRFAARWPYVVGQILFGFGVVLVFMVRPNVHPLAAVALFLGVFLHLLSFFIGERINKRRSGEPQKP